MKSIGFEDGIKRAMMAFLKQGESLVSKMFHFANRTQKINGFKMKCRVFQVACTTQSFTAK